MDLFLSGRCCSRSCIHVPSQGSCSFISFACYICKHFGRIKARAYELTPTITCTSSNVVQTIFKVDFIISVILLSSIIQ